jgi:hypothetical protein
MSDADFEGFLEDLSNLIPDLRDGTYECEITKAEYTDGRDGRRWAVLGYEVIEDGPFIHEEIGPELFRVFTGEEFETASDEEKKTLKRNYRNFVVRMENLGFARNRIPTDLSPLVGKKCILKVRIREGADGKKSYWVDSAVPASSVANPVGLKDF